MTPNEYQQDARLPARLVPPELGQLEIRTLGWCLGLAGESGELLDYVKKGYFHNHNMETVEIKKELGDILWYVANLAIEFGLTLEEIMAANTEKLLARYPDKFDPERSRNRQLSDTVECGVCGLHYDKETQENYNEQVNHGGD